MGVPCVQFVCRERGRGPRNAVQSYSQAIPGLGLQELMGGGRLGVHRARELTTLGLLPLLTLAYNDDLVAVAQHGSVSNCI